MTKKTKVGKRKILNHPFVSGYTRPFRANCRKCGAKSNHAVHEVESK